MLNSEHCPPDPRRLVLASASPRRQELLRNLGIDFVVDPSDIEEDLYPGAVVAEAVRSLAIQKALEVALRHPEGLIVAADTLVGLDGMIFAKPASADEAVDMLRQMRGRSHQVFTGVVVLDSASGAVEETVVETAVRFRAISDAEIDAYVRTGEPMDKAGAYGIQGLGALFVEGMDGDYWNVVGLPLVALNQLLSRAGCCLVCRSFYDRSPA